MFILYFTAHRELSASNHMQTRRKPNYEVTSNN